MSLFTPELPETLAPLLAFLGGLICWNACAMRTRTSRSERQPVSPARQISTNVNKLPAQRTDPCIAFQSRSPYNQSPIKASSSSSHHTHYFPSIRLGTTEPESPRITRYTMLAFALLPLLALSAMAIKVTVPNNSTGWTSTGPQMIMWDVSRWSTYTTARSSRRANPPVRLH